MRDSLELRVVLEEEHPRIAEHGRSAPSRSLPTAERHDVRRRIVLRLLPGHKVVLTGWLLRLDADAMSAADGSQAGVG